MRDGHGDGRSEKAETRARECPIETRGFLEVKETSENVKLAPALPVCPGRLVS